MANVYVNETSLQDIADSIRAKNGTQNTYKPGQMAAAIDALPSGGITPTGTLEITANGTYNVTNYASAEVDVPQSGITPTGTISITQNGTVDVTNYASASVSVPNSYSASDEGKVVDGGALVSQTSDTVTENGTYDTTTVSSLTVNVSGGGGGSSNFATGVFTLETGVTSYTIDTGINYDYFVIFEDGGTSDGTRYLRSMTNDFTRATGQNLTVATTNNSGTAIAGFYYTDSTWGAKNGTSFTYTSRSNSTKIGAGISYRWVAWKES